MCHSQYTDTSITPYISPGANTQDRAELNRWKGILIGIEATGFHVYRSKLSDLQKPACRPLYGIGAQQGWLSIHFRTRTWVPTQSLSLRVSPSQECSNNWESGAWNRMQIEGTGYHEHESENMKDLAGWLRPLRGEGISPRYKQGVYSEESCCMITEPRNSVPHAYLTLPDESIEIIMFKLVNPRIL